MVRWVGQRSGSAGGFTLIELLIVIVILAISAAIVVPMASSAASMQLRSAANIVAADLEYAKSLAIGTGQPHSVAFDADTESYRIYRTSDNADVQNPITKKTPYLVNFTEDGRLDRVGIVSSATVTFDYLGSSASAATITLQAGEGQKTVAVEAVTGFISISE
ncbi:MAG: GspH/FimT family pseudopilin [Phycisphaerae bacterium]|nr:GspH/FimT family pseudopilin [Phycisphaerae bacterium]